MKDLEHLDDNFCKVIGSILKILEVNLDKVKIVAQSKFDKMNWNSFDSVNDKDILATICNAVDLPVIELTHLANRKNDNMIYFVLEDFANSNFMSKITDYMLFFIKKTQQRQEKELEIETEDEEEDDSDIGLTLCRNNIQSLIQFVFYVSKFDKKQLFALPQIIKTLMTQLNSGSDSTSDSLLNPNIYSISTKRLISNVIHQICTGIQNLNHTYKSKVSQQICLVTLSFLDSCKGEGLVHLISQLRPNNVKRSNLSR